MPNAKTYEMKDLMRLARAQGWEVINHRTAYEFRAPNGASPIRTTALEGHGFRGNKRANFVSLLRRAGLILDDHPPKQEQPEMSNPNGATPAPLTLERASTAEVIALAEESANAIGALDAMLGELADQFAQYRKHSQDEAMKLRRDADANKARVAALEETVSKQADAMRAAYAANAKLHQERDDEMAELRAMVAAAAREAAKPKADPLAAFRERLK